MKKNLQKLWMLALLMVFGTVSSWALTADLSLNYELAGYKAKAFYDFTGNADGVLPTEGDLRFRNGYGLYNFGSGNRSGNAAIDVNESDLIVCQFADTQGRSVTINSISGCTKSTTLNDGSHIFFTADSELSTLTFNVGRGGCVVSVLIMEVDNTVATADYTLNYIYDGNPVKTVNATGAVGATVLTDASFFANDVKYFRANGEPESFVIAAGDNIFTVNVRLAEIYDYTLLNNLGETITTGSGFEGETVTVGYPRYLLADGAFYEAGKSNNEYRAKIALNEDNTSATVTYTLKEGVNAVFYAEGEKTEGMTVSTAGNIPVRASGAEAGVAEEDVTITTLPAGKYIFHAGIFTSKSSYGENTVNFGIGEQTFSAAFTNVNLCEVASAEYELLKSTEIKYLGTSSWIDAQFDYIWIEKTGDAELPPFDPSTAIANASFEGEYTVYSNPSADRAIYQPAGWTLTYENGEGNDMTALNSECLAWNSFSGKPQPTNGGNNTYWIRFRWGSNESLTLSQIVKLPAGDYKLSADAFFNGAKGGSATISAAGQSTAITGNSVWANHSVTFSLAEETEVTIAFNLTQTSQVENIAAFDNFTLTTYDPLADAKAKLQDEITAAEALVENAALADGKEELNAAITAAKKALAEATTAEQFSAAIEALKAAEAAFNKAQTIAANAALVAGASIDNPVSAPFVVNGTFDSNDMSAWKATGGYQNNTRKTTDDANAGIMNNSKPWYENWNKDAKVNKMSQVIDNIPNGVYKLNITAFVNNLQDPNESQFVFANADQILLTEKAANYEVYTKVENNTLEVGLEQTVATANWMGIDNVALLYFGTEGTVEDAKMAAPKNNWKIAKAAAEAALNNEDYANVTGSEKSALEAEIAKAEPASSEAYVAATEALTSATGTFVAAKDAYDTFVSYNKTLDYADAAKKPVVTNESTAATIMATLRAYYESNANAEGVEGAEIIADKIVNADASDGNNGWTVSGNMNAPRNNESWTDANGKNDYMYFDGGNWNANSWDVNFAQDITLEAGKYVLSAIMRASTNVDLKLFAGTDSVKAEVIGSAGNVFDRGWNYSFVTFDVAAEGTVNIGARGITNNSHEWMSFADFRLVRIEKPEFQPAYGTLWTEAQSSQVDENGFNYITLENKYFKKLAKVGDTIKVAISSVGNQPASSRPRIVTDGTLILKIDNAGETLEHIQQGTTSADLVLDADEIANIQNGANVVLSWKNMTVAQVDLIEKVEAVKTDYTDYITNADLTDSENKGWDDAGTKGIDGSGIVKASTGATFNFSQTIANLPAGKYKLTAQAAYRYSGSEADEYAAMQTDAITKFAQLYATVGTKNTNALVQNRYDGASDTDLAGEGAVQVNNLWVPNSSNAVKAWFAAGKYVNEVEFNLPADGDVKIGIVKTTSPEAGDYTVIGPWTLTRLGDAEQEPEPEPQPGDDMTKFIVNNSFETGDLTGWTVGSSSDTGVKPNSNGTYTTEGCDGDYLFNTWWQGIPITQTITNLPKGKYELKALMANDAITAGNKPCLYLLANGDHSEAFSSPNAGTFAEGTMEFYVTDGTATIGAIGGNADGSFTEAGYYWYKVDNFRLTFVEALPNIDDIEIPEGKMSNAAAQALADAKAAGDVVALLEAVKMAKASIEAYAHLNGVLNELTDILEKTNVYTAEAKQTFDTAFNTAQTGYNDGTISDADAKAFNYGSRLEGLLPSLLLSAYTSTVNGTPYINTWSVEGNNDGTNYLTPFFEYWVGDTESLAENTITATMDDVQKGIYDVTAWVRVRIKNGATAPATGIFFQVNDQTGESVVGEQLGNTQFYLKEMAAKATVDTDGKLTIKFNVAAENNISWLAFKNVKFTLDENATVGITNVNNAKNANDAIYNLNGQKVEKAKKGLYIINGKKVVLK